jgi:hypothetical protein
MLTRLQALETRTQREQELAGQVRTLEGELQELRSLSAPGSTPLGPVNPDAPSPRSQPQAETTPSPER